jgi:hypothetical protein
MKNCSEHRRLGKLQVVVTTRGGGGLMKAGPSHHMLRTQFFVEGSIIQSNQTSFMCIWIRKRDGFLNPRMKQFVLRLSSDFINIYIYI